MIPATGWVSTFGVREGVAVLVRRTDEPEYQARLMRAAEVLAATDHPGVERLVAIETDDDGTTLTTHFAGGRSLAGSPPTDARGLAPLAAALAQLFDDLHRSGTVHGPLARHHVVLADGDRPVLCGFSAGQLHSALDDETWSACRADDVRSIGALLLVLLDAMPAPRGIAPRERIARMLLRRAAQRTTEGRAADAAVVASWCASAAGAFRISELLGRRSDADRGPASSRRAELVCASARPRPPSPWRPSGLSIAGAFVGATCVLAGVLGLVTSGRRSAPSAAESRPGLARPAGAIETTIHCPPPAGPPHGDLLDIDSDGCPERVHVDGSNLVVAGTRYQVGKAGDLLEIGDWDGDGIATPALVRPVTGAVFAFEGWPSPGQPLVAHPVARVHDVTGVRVHHREHGHDSLVLDRSSGPPVPLDLDRPDS